MRKYNLLFCLVSLSTAVYMSCSDSSGQNCVPGDVKTCPCLGGTQGVQECADDGSRWEACQCPEDPEPDGAADGDGGDQDAGSDGNADDGAPADDGTPVDDGGDEGGEAGDPGTDDGTDGGDIETDADAADAADAGGGDGGDVECQLGSIEYQDCGTCGWETRTCIDPGNWDDWSGCTEEGPCLPPATQDIPCGNCGTQSQECLSQCSTTIGGYCKRECWWADVGACTDQGPCSPPQTQPCDLCGTQNCRQICEWGRCDYAVPGPAPDQFEPNDSEADEVYLGEVSDDEGFWQTTASYTNINPEGDVDHFLIRFNDDTPSTFGPELGLTVPTGHTLEINVRAECWNGGGSRTTTHEFGEGGHAFYVDFECCSSGCLGTDSQDVHIWISAVFSDSCEAYTLQWRGD